MITSTGNIPLSLLETHLTDQPFSSAELLSDYLQLFQANTDAAIVKMLQVKLLIPASYIPFSTCCYAPCDLIFETVKLCTSVYILIYLHFTKGCEIDFTKDK